MAIDFMAFAKAGQEAQEAQEAVDETTQETLPVKAQPFDLAPVRTALSKYDNAIAEMQAQAQALEVKDEGSNSAAVALAGKAKKIFKAIEAARKGFVSDPNAYVRSVNGLAKNYQAMFGEVENGLKQKIAQYRHRVELDRRKAEEAARKATEAAQKKIDAEAKAANVAPVKLDKPVVPKKENVTRTENGAAHIQKVWTFEIEDEAQVPREYLMVNEKAIREAVKAGVREIPGVKVYQESKTVIRT